MKPLYSFSEFLERGVTSNRPHSSHITCSLAAWVTGDSGDTGFRKVPPEIYFLLFGLYIFCCWLSRCSSRDRPGIRDRQAQELAECLEGAQLDILLPEQGIHYEQVCLVGLVPTCARLVTVDSVHYHADLVL